MDQDVLTKLRGIMLEIMDEFVRICEENNLTYFLTAGTLIGAVRHKGFIPWDDDIDIAMPRKDYEIFLDYYEKNHDTKYYLLSSRNSVNTSYHYYCYSKLCKKETIFANEYRAIDAYSGIYIDIWPYDNCLLGFVNLQTRIVKLSQVFYRMKTNYYVPRQKYLLFISKIVKFIFPLKLLKIIFERSSLIFNKYKTKHISFFSGLNGCKKETHRNDTIFPLSSVEFEGKFYSAPGNWDEFLKRLYGNYMELPPVEKQVSHHKLVYIMFDNSTVYLNGCYWKKSETGS